jgi:hypothetical protein
LQTGSRKESDILKLIEMCKKLNLGYMAEEVNIDDEREGR